jgi:O-antigen ligase
MLTYIGLCVTAYLVRRIWGATCKADAIGYLLVSGLMPLPVYMIGRSVTAGVFPIDVCLGAYIAAHGLPRLDYATERRALSTGIVALLGLSILATCSGIFNYFFVDQDPLKFYVFTTVKFWEYSLLGLIIIASRPDAAQLRRICTIVLAGILAYEVVHALHITGIVPLSGEEYFGVRAEDHDLGASPFSDRSQWFLTTPRVVVGGTASVSLWFSLMVFEARRGAIKVAAAAAATLSVFSVLATSSRSDIAGLVVSAVVFIGYAPLRRWKVYACAVVVVAGLYAAWLTFTVPSTQKATEMTRLRELWDPELRAEGNYAVRSFDRTSLLRYLPDHPRGLLIGAGPGNFHWYRAHGITKNFFGHNSYLHWTGELGIGGLFLLLAWCLFICIYTKGRLRSAPLMCQLGARACLAIVIGRMVAAWGAESLFGTEGMGQYSLFFVGVVYLLATVPPDLGGTGARFCVRRKRFGTANSMLRERMLICSK